MNRVVLTRFAGALLALTLCLNGCTSMKLVPGTGGDAVPTNVAVGMRIQVLDRSGVSTDIKVTDVRPEYVEGQTRDGRRVRFAREDVREVRERRLAPGKTAALTLGVLYAVGLAVVLGSGAPLSGL
jgi:hypothetical protein